ncbi:MAG TPA: CHAT domain-containing tetratricopeptide repeat protein [Cytophagaceae bacterium]|nr:CHAT domain-containing tetratricopeptide repeat protein [Cytophagaceae bacterium]
MKQFSISFLLLLCCTYCFAQGNENDPELINANLSKAMKANDPAALKKWSTAFIQYHRNNSSTGEKKNLETLFTLGDYYHQHSMHNEAIDVDYEIVYVMEGDYELNDADIVNRLNNLQMFYKNIPMDIEEKIQVIKMKNAENFETLDRFMIYWDTGNYYYDKLNHTEALFAFSEVYENASLYTNDRTILQEYWMNFLGDYCSLVASGKDKQLLGELTSALAKHCSTRRDLSSHIYLNTTKGDCFMTQSMVDSAKFYFDRSLAIISADKKAKPSVRLSALDDMIRTYVEAEDLRSVEKAIVSANKLLPECEKEPGAESVLIRYYENIGEYYNSINNNHKTLEAFQQALKYAGKYEKENPVAYNFLLLKISLTNVHLDDLPSAAKALISPTVLFSNPSTQQTPEYASFCNYKAIYFYEAGNKDSAGYYFRKGFETYVALEGYSSRNALANLLNLSRFYEETNDYSKALTGYRQAFNGFLLYYSPKHSLLTDALSGLGSASYASSNFDQARKSLAWVRSNILFTIENNFSFLTEQERKEYYDDLSQNLQNYYFISSKLIGSPEVDAATQDTIREEIFSTVLTCKGLLLRSGERFKRAIIATNDPALIEKYNNWNSIKYTLGKYHTLSHTQQKASGLDLPKLTVEAAALEKELARVSLKSDALNPVSAISYSDIKASLGNSEALVEIIRTQERFSQKIAYTVLIATRESNVPVLLVLDEGNKMENQYLKYYQNGIKFKLTDTLSYQAYLKPIVDFLTAHKISKVYISADGVYHQLSLGSIYVPGSKKYMIDLMDLHFISSSKDLLQNPPSVFNPTRSFLFGDPDFNSGTENQDTTRSVTMNGTVFNRLPGTAQEVKTIREVLGETEKSITVFEATEAGEAQVKELHDAELLHIATHGYFIESGKYVSVSEAMLSSGLIMAGAGDFLKNNTRLKGEDGFLTAYEISLQDYDKIQLVVLSACETGKGLVYAGDGVFGLQRAFYQAGADNLLMSLWKVDDTATRDLMIAFYKQMQQKKFPQEAYLTAMKEIKARYPHPYYWGAFVLIQNAK